MTSNSKGFALSFWLVILIAPIILLAPILFTGKAMFWGTPSLQFVPWRHLAWETIRSGHLPLWNPLVGMGAPLLANYQSALLYPPNWLLFILDEIGGVEWAAWGQGLIVAMHLTWAGAGMYVLAGKLGLGNLGKTMCGLAFGLSGYLVGRSGFLSINSAVAWLPWVLVYSVSFGESEKIINRNTLKLAIIWMFQLLAGHAQTTWYTILLVFMWSGMWNWSIAHSQYELKGNSTELNHSQHTHVLAAQRVVREWCRIILAIGIGFLLSAIQLIPTGEYLLQSQRSNAVDYDFAATYSFWPWRLLTLMAPGMFGSPVSSDYWGYGNYWEDALYVGLLPLMLGISVLINAAIYRPKSPDSVKFGFQTGQIVRRKVVLFLMVLILVSMVLALGKNTPIYPWLYKHLPTMDMFNSPTRFSIWTVFALALLAGMGADVWRRPTGRSLYWSRLGIAGAFAITIGSGVTWILLGDVSPTFIRATALLGILGLGAGFLTLTAPPEHINSDNGGPFRNPLWELSVIAFVMTDLLVANWGLIPGIDRNFYSIPFDRKNRTLKFVQDGRIYLPDIDEHRLKFNRFFRFDSFTIVDNWHNLGYVMLPNLNILGGIASANNFDPLLPGRYDRWMKALNHLFHENDQAKIDYLLNLMNVSAVEFMDYSMPLGVDYLERSGMARLRWVPCSLHASDDENAWHLVLNRQINYEMEVVLETGSTAFQGCSISTSTESSYAIIAESPNQISILADSGQDGWLVLSDVWYPGWHAYVDHEKVSILRANYLFQAIYLPAGIHKVSFSYSPTSFRVGAFVTIVSWALLIVGWLILRRHNRCSQFAGNTDC